MHSCLAESTKHQSGVLFVCLSIPAAVMRQLMKKKSMHGENHHAAQSLKNVPGGTDVLGK